MSPDLFTLADLKQFLLFDVPSDSNERLVYLRVTANENGTRANPFDLGDDSTLLAHGAICGITVWHKEIKQIDGEEQDVCIIEIRTSDA